MNDIQFILYLANQQKSRDFYADLLQLTPVLDVPGMTEFQLKPGVKLGLMPEQGIGEMLAKVMPHPGKAGGVPRCELYLKVNNAALYMQRAVKNKAVLVSNLQQRDWGDVVGYVADLDGHIVAFAETK